MKMLTAVNNFLLAFSGYVQEQILQGYQNRVSLYNTQGYVVFTVEDTQRIGMNISDYSESSDSKFTTKMLREYVVSIDFCGVDESTARAAANAIEVVANGQIGQTFFADYETMLNYADDLEYLPFADLDQEFIHRYRVNLHLTRYESVTIPQEYAEKLQFKRVENIDAHHTP